MHPTHYSFFFLLSSRLIKYVSLSMIMLMKMINSSSDNKFNFEKQAVLWLAVECWVKGA